MKYWLLLFTLCAHLSWADEIVLAADPWCPYNCVPDSDHPGYLVELATLALEQHGHSVKYINVPWNRAIRMARAGLVDGIIGTSKDETPDFVFPRKPFIDVMHGFFTVRQSRWRYEGIDSLRSIRLGVLKDYFYGDSFEAYLQQNEKNSDRLTVVHSDQGLPQLIRLLKSGRIDAFIEERGVVRSYTARQSNNDLKSVGVGFREHVYIALSPQKPKSAEYAIRLSDAYDAIEGTDTHLALLKKYQLDLTRDRPNEQSQD